MSTYSASLRQSPPPLYPRSPIASLYCTTALHEFPLRILDFELEAIIRGGTGTLDKRTFNDGIDRAGFLTKTTVDALGERLGTCLMESRQKYLGHVDI